MAKTNKKKTDLVEKPKRYGVATDAEMDMFTNTIWAKNENAINTHNHNDDIVKKYISHDVTPERNRIFCGKKIRLDSKANNDTTNDKEI